MIDDYKCANCNKKTKLFKKSYVWKYPKLLFIFVNRFAWSYGASKKDGAISLENRTHFSLDNFCVNNEGKHPNLVSS